MNREGMTKAFSFVPINSNIEMPRQSIKLNPSVFKQANTNFANADDVPGSGVQSAKKPRRNIKSFIGVKL